MSSSTGTERPALRLAGVSATYGFGRRAAPVIRDVSLRVAPGRTMGVVGESGSGKSTLAKVVVGLVHISAGTVEVDGTDVAAAKGAQRRSLRRRVQLIPQDPYASLDPRMTIGRTLLEALAPRRETASADHRQQIEELLRLVALEPDAARRRPHEFSGGQRQRIAIARAIAVRPALLVADEVTSALDASIQFEILDLLDRLQQEIGFGCVFITHNLGVAARMCDDITVMRAGRVVEQGPIAMLAAPTDPYTRLLVGSVPDPAGEFLRAPSAYEAPVAS
ncbi:ABC transporter ATP-binding protein [Microbacterium sp. CPCC 204701]|uniref:ABC transporter ATP-binding protein n=1 Tax=Microbacterium sp. CPCC 204701 TaxID=2493084 RepID=UPI000FD7ACB9|nr:ABC transporter ATP-binding protein [Microbacterium sp. CPCC 204701]